VAPVFARIMHSLDRVDSDFIVLIIVPLVELAEQGVCELRRLGLNAARLNDPGDRG
jgi:hypothetical protein